MKYGIHPDFLKEFVQVPISKKTVGKLYVRSRTMNWDQADPLLASLDTWVKKLTIDGLAARVQLGLHKRKKNKSYWLNLLALEKLERGELGLASVDERGRVYHNLTCLWSKFRGCLRLDGEKLVNLDVANSQPLFLSVLMSNKQNAKENSPPSPVLLHNYGSSAHTW